MPPPAAAPAIEAVLFDYGLVLSGPPHPPAWQRMRALLGADEDAFHAAYWRPRHDYDRGALNADGYWRTVAGELRHPFSPELGQVLIDADTALWTQPNQPMIDWAAALQAAGVRTGILSNLGDAMEAGVLRHCPWLSGFHHLTFSHRLGIAKPDTAIYRHAVAALGVEPARVLFLDDREDNIQAAKAVGLQTIQYTDHSAFLQEMQRAHLDYLLQPATKV